MRTMKNIKFGDYEWPHNPHTVETTLTKDIIRHKYPGIDGEELETLGMQARVINGRGAFFGKNAYDDYKKLRVLIIENNVNKFFHPNWGVTDAVLADIKATNTTMVDYVEYEFTFIEHKNIQVIKALPKPSTSSTNAGGSNSGSTNTTSGSACKVGGTLTINTNAKTYATGETIPNWVKQQSHTIMQIKDNKFLLKEIYSWVNASDTVCGGGTTGNTTTQPKEYKVVQGDTLSGISLKFYKTANNWRAIADANKSKIKDPNLIYPGQVLTIP